MSASRPLCRTSSLEESFLARADRLTCQYRSVPTKDQILVPETLLKKRKSQEKERAEAAEKRDARKKVHISLPSPKFLCTLMKKYPTTPRLAYGRCCRIVNHLSGLTVL